MAALLKKRAVAQFSQVIQEETRPIKKLKLVHRSPSFVSLDLQCVTTSHDALQRLLQFEEDLSVAREAAPNIVRELLDYFHKEKEPLVRCKIAFILGEIVKLPDFNSENLVDDILSLLKSEKSHKVIGKLIEVLEVIGKTTPQNMEIHKQLIDNMQQYLKDPSHIVRGSCVNLIGSIGSPDHVLEASSHSEEPISVQSLLTSMTRDQDPRVRSSALKAMLQFHQRGLSLGLAIYQEGCNLLKDDYEGVRLAAIKLIWVLSHQFPESNVTVPDSQEEIRLVDDGFAKICDMVNDISVKVRVEASSLLGSLHQVSAKFLDQTLDKKLMSNMREKLSAHQRAKEHFASGGWSTGQKWADDAPKQELEAEDVSLMNIGACGAFVHGTEDEFLEVRNAALDSLCELAVQSQSFANKSQDYIIDMFNDEIESVRQNAINSLRKLSHLITLREDQLEIILGVLQDFSFTTREATRDMLCEMRVSTKDCLNACIVALLDNLRRYPQDRTSVWKCMKHLAKRQPHLVLPLVPDLMCLHPYFDTPEPDMDDPAYISVLILLFNAAEHCPTMIPMFQEFTWKHYNYLQDSLPDTVPKLQVPGRTDLCMERSDAEIPDTTNFVQESLRQLDSIITMDTATAEQILEVMVRDLKQIIQLDEKVSASAECVCMFLQSQLLLTKMITGNHWLCTNSVTDENILSTIDNILSILQKIEMLFLGLGNTELSMVRQTQLKAQCIQILIQLKTDNKHYAKLKSEFLLALNQTNKFLTANQIKPDAFCTFLFSVLEDLDSNKINVFIKYLQTASKSIKPDNFPVTNNIRKTSATLHEPSGNSDNQIKFAAGLVTSIPVQATLDNVLSTSSIKLQVKYADQTVQLITPKPGDFLKLSPLRFRLVSQALLSHSLWSDPTHVEICIAMDTQQTQRVREVTCGSYISGHSVIELCKPVKVLVAPKAVKR